MTLIQIIALIISLVFSAFFSGLEMAFVSANKLRIELDKNQGTISDKLVGFFAKKPGHFIATMLIGNNIALVIYGIIMGNALRIYIEPFISSEFSIFLTQTIVSTLIILITAEFLPKTLFRVNPNSTIKIFSIPLVIFYYLFFPVTVVTMFISNNLVGRLIGNKEMGKEKMVFGKVDLDNLVTESQSDAKGSSEIVNELKIFQNALDFSNVKLRECMVPRTELEAIEINRPIDELRKKIIESGFSKILIFEDSIDNIVGYFHSSELFQNPKDIKSRLIQPLFVPETMPANKLLRRFIQQHKSIAIVVDEFGGTAGIVTIEDIMEEIFGEIEDEHDINEHDEKQLSPNEYLFSARLEIDYINEKYNISLPESDDYETIAGFILYNYNNIPKLNAVVKIDSFEFKITKVSTTRIEQIHLTIKN